MTVILAVPSNSVSDIVVINGCSDKSVSDCDSDIVSDIVITIGGGFVRSVSDCDSDIGVWYCHNYWRFRQTGCPHDHHTDASVKTQCRKPTSLSSVAAADNNDG